ncbi:hypothetical protein MKM44_08775 [Streptococcus suis]|nr:hypothetical protein [Streptococcus suis]
MSFDKLKEYLPYRGVKYIKPEKAGNYRRYMMDLRYLARQARDEFSLISKSFEDRVKPLKAERVSQWMNQSQLCRPHFWCYFRLPSDGLDDSALAIRLYGESDNFGISVEVSFVERRRSENSLEKQNKVLNLLPFGAMYYFVQKNGISFKMDATEENRKSLLKQVKSGEVRKVLVKQDIPIETDHSLERLIDDLLKSFDELLPFYKETKK